MTCPRCRGAMFRDLDGPACVNCGYVRYPEPPDPYTREQRHKGHRGPQAKTIAREGSGA